MAQGIYLTVSLNELPLSACELHVDPALSHKNWPIRESHVKCHTLKELCHETAHAREVRVNLKRLAQLFQVSRGYRHSEFIASNLGHPRIFFAFSGFVT